MTYRAINRLFTLICFAVPPIAGSAVSFLWHGGALWCLAEIVTGRRRLSPDRTMRLLALLMAVYVAANAIAFFVNPWSAGELAALLPLVTFLLFPFSYSVWLISDKDEIAAAAIWGSAIASFGALVFAVVQYYFVGIRAEGGAGNALIFADVASLSGLVCLAGALLPGMGRARLLLLAYAAAFAAVLLSGSRSVWIVLIGATVMILFLNRRQLGTVLKGRVLAIVIILVAIGLLTSGLVLSRVSMVGDDLTALSASGDYNTSIGLRIALWEIAMKLIAEAPLFGHGAQHTLALIGEHLGSDYAVDRSFSHFHNGFLTACVEGGLFSGLAMIAIFGTILVIAVRVLLREAPQRSRFGATLLLILFAIYVGGGSFNLIFGHDIMDSVFMVVLITGLYLAAGTTMPPREGNRPVAAADA